MTKHTALALTAMAFAAATYAATLEETFDRTFDVRAGSTFTLENTNGHITVRSWDQPRVRVVGEKRVESRDADAARKAFAELRVEPWVSSDGVHIVTHYPRSNDGGLFDWLAGTNISMAVNYEISVPRTMNIELDNTNGGIDVSDVKGSMHISNTNGHIELLRCAGDVDAETTNGHVRAELSEVTAGKAVRLETTNGRITIALPRNVGARLDASTTNGRINTDLPVATTRVEKTSLRGSINGGGPEVRLRTTNGSIDIQAR